MKNIKITSIQNKFVTVLIHLNSHCTEKWTLALSYNSSWAALGKRAEKPLTFIRKKTSIRVTLRQGAHLPRLVGGKEVWRENLC